MTNQNNAAQPGQDPIYDAIFILTEEADSLSECHTRTPGDWAGEPEAKARYDHIRAVVDALSKLRAPVADERAAQKDEPLPVVARLYYGGSPSRRYRRASTRSGPGEPLCFVSVAEVWLRRKDAQIAALEKELAASPASAPAANDLTPAGMKEICPECGHQFGCFHSPYIDRLRALASAPVAGDVPSDMPTPIWWINHGLHGQITLRQDEADRARQAGAAVYQYHAAPQASEAGAAIMRFNPFPSLGMNPAPNGMYVRYEDHAAMLCRHAAPQASGPITHYESGRPNGDGTYEAVPVRAAPQAGEAVRILFPTHLRKMWSGGEVQAWLDERQGVTAPKPSAKGSLERYRKWQTERDEAFAAGVKAAADLVKKMVDAYDTDHGSTDPETGTREYPGEGAAWVCEMQELEESIRALSAQPGAQKKGGSDAE